jgi:hypothetical protein
MAVEFGWRPTVKFFGVREAVLVDMEDRQAFEGFIWGADDVSLRLGRFEAIRVGTAGATYWIGSPKRDLENVRATVNSFVERMVPKSIGITRIELQCLSPLSEDPVVAQGSFTTDLFAEHEKGTAAIDSALLVDGRCGRLHALFQTEYGVVSEDEIARRLSGQGRLTPVLPMPVEADLADLPHCSLFSRWFWHSIESPESDWQSTQILVDEILIETTKMCEQVVNRHRLRPLQSDAMKEQA